MNPNLQIKILLVGLVLVLIVEKGICDICELPPDSGECEVGQPRQMISRHYYSHANLACSSFPYSGCGGNKNNFALKTDCEEACSNHKKKVQNLLLDSNSTSKCYYEGTYYDINEEIPTNKTDYPCSSGCLCIRGSDNFPRIICASVDCPPEPFDESNCSNPILVHNNSSCCPEYKCANEDEPTCTYNGEKFYFGQAIYPDEYSCFKCSCGTNFTGQITTKDDSCTEIKCGVMLYRQQEIMNSCEPQYYTTNTGKTLCCPIDWKC